MASVHNAIFKQLMGILLYEIVKLDLTHMASFGPSNVYYFRVLVVSKI